MGDNELKAGVENWAFPAWKKEEKQRTEYPCCLWEFPDNLLYHYNTTYMAGAYSHQTIGPE